MAENPDRFLLSAQARRPDSVVTVGEIGSAHIDVDSFI
jgi:hypothetical protein